jgi:hypothetical protein
VVDDGDVDDVECYHRSRDERWQEAVRHNGRLISELSTRADESTMRSTPLTRDDESMTRSQTSMRDDEST